MSELPRRRRRPAISCTLCRQRKIRCNREQPCSSCIRSRNHACHYENLPVPPPCPQGSEHDTTSHISTATTAPTSDVEYMKKRITQLEDQLQSTSVQPSLVSSASPSTVLTPPSHIETAESRMGGTFLFHHGDPARGQPVKTPRNLTHKKRMYGQSHWMNFSVLMIRDIAQKIDEQTRDPNEKVFTEKTFAGMQKCKQLARMIKAQRTPPWPCPPTLELPPKQIADELVDCYLHTYENVYRILHVPSFKRSYEVLWVTDTRPDPTFLVQLKLILAIGAVSYDHNFTLRPSATRWVYEGETWISNPQLKHRLSLQYIQIYCLQIIARETVAVAEDMVFLSTGTLLRSAIFLGLHRDPANLPGRTVFSNEMHRRLWSTVLELCLQASMNAGCPPLLSHDDFDTLPAGNFDDDQLENEDAVPRPDTYFTRTSISISLRKTSLARLEITRFLNNWFSSGTYEETLRLDDQLRTAYKDLKNTLRKLDSKSDSVPSDFQIRMVDTIMNRYICALHTPFFVPALSDAKYAFSRRVTFDCALKMWYATHPPHEDLGPDGSIAPGKDYFQRLVTCGHGFLRTVAMQSVLMIAVEVKAQIQEDNGLSSTPVRRDLFAILEEAKEWSRRCMEAGETNVKGDVFMHLMSAYTQSLARGFSDKQIAKALVEAAKQGTDRGISVLEMLLEQVRSDQTLGELEAMSLDLSSDMMAGWQDIRMPEGFCDPFTLGMNWTFDQAGTQSAWLF